MSAAHAVHRHGLEILFEGELVDIVIGTYGAETLEDRSFFPFEGIARALAVQADEEFRAGHALFYILERNFGV